MFNNLHYTDYHLETWAAFADDLDNFSGPIR